MVSNSTPVPEGTVIMAESQTAGRGQLQNKWFSSAGESLAFSILLYPDFLPLSKAFDLTRAISLGVFDTLERLLGKDLQIKWPNDIYYAGHKLGGMLIENQVQGNHIKSAVIGIGLNINQFRFPDWVPNAISIKQILHTDYDLKPLLSQICSDIERWYIKLKAGEERLIRTKYLQCLYQFGIAAMFKAGGEVFEGTIKGVSEAGLLEVERQNGIRLYNLKEIEFLSTSAL